MRGRLHIKTTQIPPFFCNIPVFRSLLSLYIPLSFTNFSHLRKKFAGLRIIVVFLLVFIYFLIFVCSKVIRLLILAPLKKISWKESKFKTMKRRKAREMESAETRNCVSKLCVSCLMSSQESSSTQYVKEILWRRIEQKRVQQNEESFSRSQDNATLSNWASILSNLGYFCEVRSIIVACGKIHGAYSRFNHWTVKSQVHLH